MTKNSNQGGGSCLKVAQNETLFPKMWWFFCSNHHLSYADKGQQKVMWGIWMKYCTRVGSKIGTQAKKSPKNILVFLFKWLKAWWTDALSLFFLIGIGFTCKKNFRKTFQRLLGRKPRRFLWSTNVFDNSSFRTFPGISQNLPENVSFFSLKW